MKPSERNILALILILCAILSISLLTRGHIWWDDFASYIMQAQSLLNGTTRSFVEHNAFTIANSTRAPGPVAYPWGFPMLLAPVVALTGVNLLALKLVNTVFYLLFIVAFYFLARLRLPAAWALGLTAILAFNPALLHAHDLVLSDIPFLFISTRAMLAIESGWYKSSTARAAATGALIFAGFALRTNGLVLLVPLLVGQLIGLRASKAAGRDWLTLGLPYFVFGALALLQALLLPGGQESYISHFSLFTPMRLLGNFWYYLRLPGEFVQGIVFGPAFLTLLVLLFTFDAVVSFRRNLVLLSYLVGTLALFVSWPETQGLRFIYPILPLFLLMAGEGFAALLSRLSGDPEAIIRWAGLLGAAALIVISLGVSARAGWNNLRHGRDINGPFDPVSTEMFDYVRKQTPSDSVVIFFKPRAMRLLTGRDSFLTMDCADLTKGDFVVINDKQGYNGQIGDLTTCTGLNLPVVYNNKRFTVYQIPH